MLEFAAWIQTNAYWIIGGLVVFIAAALLWNKETEITDEDRTEMDTVVKKAKRIRKEMK